MSTHTKYASSLALQRAAKPDPAVVKELAADLGMAEKVTQVKRINESIRRYRQAAG